MRGLLLALLCVALSSCSIVKPIVCSFTWPVLMFTSELDSEPLFGSDTVIDGDAAMFSLGLIFAVGPVGGLVTGVISDVNVLIGESENPLRNLSHPLRTNSR